MFGQIQLHGYKVYPCPQWVGFLNRIERLPVDRGTLIKAVQAGKCAGDSAADILTQLFDGSLLFVDNGLHQITNGNNTRQLPISVNR